MKVIKATKKLPTPKVCSFTTDVIVAKSPSPGKAHGRIGYITNAYLRAEFRGSGIGTSILEKLQLFAEHHNIELLFLWPSDESVSFYERSGFSDNNEIFTIIILIKHV